jgi:hypothetical protein
MVLIRSNIWQSVGFFDERIQSILKDGNPRLFTQLLGEAGFSHNTLKLHPKKLLKEGLLARGKSHLDELGRPKYTYAIPPRLRKQVSVALSDPIMELVHLPFGRLKHLCRFEKGGYCKVSKDSCFQRCPQVPRSRE